MKLPIAIAFSFFAACASKTEPAATAPAKPVAAAPGTPTATAAAEHDHASCEGASKDCPFHDEKAAVAAVAKEPEHEGCAEHEAAAAAGTNLFGQAFAITEAKPLAQVLAAATPDTELTVRVAGKVDKVCKKAGCWMVVRDGDLEARVIMKDHAFTVPKDSEGKQASVEGQLKVRVFTEAQAKHLAEDGGEDPAKVTGEKKEYLLTATTVQFGG